MALLPKGESKGLTGKSSQQGEKKFYIGAAWDGDVDLDLMIVPVKGGIEIEESTVYFNNMEAFGGAIKHNGDARNGDAPGDDESIIVCVDGVDADHLVVAVFAYNVPDMSLAKNTKFTIRDGDSEAATLLYELPMSDDDVEGETILVSCVLSKDGTEWNARSVADFVTKFKHGDESLNGVVSIAASYCTA